LAAEGLGNTSVAGRTSPGQSGGMTGERSLRRAKLILRVAASVATLQAAAHLPLFLRSQPKPGSAAWPLAQAMRMQPAPGHTTYWGMYFGYGLLAALTAFFIAALIWLAASFDVGSRRLAQRLVVLVLLAVLVHSVLIARYFFVLPLLFDIVVAALLAIGAAAMLNAARSVDK
jgi:hypothetical protein